MVTLECLNLLESLVNIDFEGLNLLLMHKHLFLDRYFSFLKASHEHRQKLLLGLCPRALGVL